MVGLKTGNRIERVSFVGSGNVATHLAVALSAAGIKVTEIYSPNHLHAAALARKVQASPVREAALLDDSVDLCIISVPDDRIGGIAAADGMPEMHGIVAHTSGITPLEALSFFKRRGVFYPLQTFTKDRDMDMTEIPFCIDASLEQDAQLLFDLAQKISKSVAMISSYERKYLHLTAVVVSNFSNHLYHVAYDILEKKGLDFQMLLPLISETAKKVQDIHPHKAQTGPAIRKDFDTMRTHLELLKEFPFYSEVYQLLSDQIIEKHGEDKG